MTRTNCLLDPTGVHLARAVVVRVWQGCRDHQVVDLAGGVAFFTLLATFPGLAALVSLTSLFADPGRVDALIDALSQLLPESSGDILARRVDSFVAAARATGSPRALSLTPLVGFAALVWGANKGTRALLRALDAILGGGEARGLLASILLALAFTVGAVAFLVFSVGLIVLLPMVLDLLGLGPSEARALDLLRWPVLLAAVTGVLAVVYRYGPVGGWRIGWRSTLAASACAAMLWLGGSILFSWFSSNLANLTEVYGSLTAVIGFLVWIWLSVIAVLVGAELAAALASCNPGAAGATRGPTREGSPSHAERR